MASRGVLSTRLKMETIPLERAARIIRREEKRRSKTSFKSRERRRTKTVERIERLVMRVDSIDREAVESRRLLSTEPG